jgi:WD40 repeat protein
MAIFRRSSDRYQSVISSLLLFVFSLFFLVGCTATPKENEGGGRKLQRVSEVELDPVQFIDISRDGSTLLATGKYGPIRTWVNDLSGNALRTIDTEGFTELVSCHFVGKNTDVFVAGKSGLAAIFSAHANKKIEYRFEPASGLAEISPDRKYIAFDGQVIDTEISAILPDTALVAVQSTVQFVDNDVLMVASVHSNSVSVRYLPQNILNTFEFDDKVMNAAIDPQKNWLAVSLQSGLMVLFDLNTKEQVSSARMEHFATGIEFVNGQLVVLQGQYFDSLSLPGLSSIHRIEFDNDIQGYDIDRNFLVLGVFSGGIYVYSMSQGERPVIVASSEFGEPVEAVRINAGVRMVMSAGRNGKIGLFYLPE